ncbi:MAG: ABC transporter ATP-binding protein [Clostridia bacterium]|nr:ABC transporter ATP-binding protein [Clostridia bacterium]
MADSQLKSVSKIYPSGALALYKVSLSFKDGEFIAVVGGEKSGKSTLLRLIAGLDEVTEGQVFVGDKDVTEVPARDRDVAMIFQGSTLYPSLNVFENIAYGLRMRKVSNAVIEQRVKAVAEILGLNDLLYRKPKALTAEQKQRVAFGRAIAREPKLYLLDDPLSGISPDVREKLRSVLVNLQIRMKGTFIYASKNVNEALTMATRMIVLREGFVQQMDTPANLYDYPANAYVAFTVGSPTINFVNGAVIEREGESVYAAFDGVRFPLAENTVKRFSKLEEYVGTDRKVILGIRPEDVKVGENGLFGATVVASEEICGTVYAECEHGKLSFAAVSDKPLAKGDKAELEIDMTHAHIFDADTRLTLLERDEGYEKTDFAEADLIPFAYAEEEQLRKKFSLSKVDKKKKK